LREFRCIVESEMYDSHSPLEFASQPSRQACERKPERELRTPCEIERVVVAGRECRESNGEGIEYSFLRKRQREREIEKESAFHGDDGADDGAE